MLENLDAMKSLKKQISDLQSENKRLNIEIDKFRPANDRLKSVIESSDIAVIDYLVPISYHLYRCPQFAKILGYDDDENFLLNQETDWFLEQIHPDDYKEMEPTIDKLCSGELDKAHFRFRFKHKSGKLIYLKLYCMVKERDKDAVSHIIAVLQDVTQQQNVDNALISSERRYHGIFENSPLSLWEEDWSDVHAYFERLKKDGITDFAEYFSEHKQAVSKCVSLVKILDINQQTLKIHNAKNKDELLTNLQTVFTDVSEQKFRDELVAFAAGKTTFQAENIHRTIDGKPLNIKLSMNIVPGYEHDLSKMVVSMMDITEKKLIEVEKDKATADLEKLQASHRELENTISICLSCNKVKRDDDYDKKIFQYLKKHPESEFTHYVCPDCKSKIIKLNLKEI